jgi:antitoxin (DNA-binding transcriptional repressor) of toxin-antitoxin stability system
MNIKIDIAPIKKNIVEKSMQQTINTKELRASLPRIVEEIKRGKQFTVLYRSRPAFRIVPIDDADRLSCPLKNDPLYHAGAVGESRDGQTATDHDAILYGTVGE